MLSPAGQKKLRRAFGSAVAVLLACAALGQAKPPATPVPAAQATSEDRQKAAHADADRLLKLAQDLKNSVDKSRKDELNVQVIREAEEIEKLARSLRSRVQ